MQILANRLFDKNSANAINSNIDNICANIKFG